MYKKFIIFIFIVIFICIYIFLIIKKYYKSNFFYNEKFTTQILSQKKFDKFILNKPNNISYKVGLKNIKIQRENCFKKCGVENCTKLYMKRLNYTNCKKCQKDKKKCYDNTLYTVGACNMCGNNLKKTNCNHKNQIGCTNPNNIYGLEGVEPYYIEVPSKSSNTPFDTKCVFCWELESYL